MFKFLRAILGRPAPPAAPDPPPPPRVNGHVHMFSAHGPMYRGDHYHVCIEPTCWSYLACDKPQAQCTVGPWTCPCCEHVHLSRWADAEERRQRTGGGNA